MARKKSIPQARPSGLDEPNLVFTMENVGELAAEIGVFDREKIEELLEILRNNGWWCYYESVANKARPPVVRQRLTLLKQKAGELLEQINDMDHATRFALASGFRRCRRRNDPRVRYIDQRLVIGAWLTIEPVRDLVDLLQEAAQGAVEVTPRGDGRPRLLGLRQICLDLAQVYQDLTGKQFAREKGQGVWTEGARWVAKVARMLTSLGTQSPTDAQLNTAMRYAVRDLANRPKIAWLDAGPMDLSDLQEPSS